MPTLEERVRALEDRVIELNGVLKALRIGGLLLGIIVGIITLAKLVAP